MDWDKRKPNDMAIIRLVLIGVPFYLFYTGLRSVIDAGSIRPRNAINHDWILDSSRPDDQSLSVDGATRIPGACHRPVPSGITRNLGVT